MQNFKAVEHQLGDEAERVKGDVDRDAEQLIQSLTINKARQAKHIENAIDTVRTHISRTQTTMARCQVRLPACFTSHVAVHILNVRCPL